MTTREPHDDAAAPLTPAAGEPITPPTAAAPAADLPASPESSALFSARKQAKRVEHTRSRATYFGWAVGIVVLILLLVFILRNQNSQDIDLLFWTVNLPIGVSLLIAAIAGAIITLAISSARILQLRSALKKYNKAAQ